VPNFERFELPQFNQNKVICIYFQIVAKHQYEYLGLNLTKLVLTYCDMVTMVWDGRL